MYGGRRRIRREPGRNKTAAPPAWPRAPFCCSPRLLAPLCGPRLCLRPRPALPTSAPAWPVPLLAPPAWLCQLATPCLLAPPPLSRLGFVLWCVLFCSSGLQEKVWIIRRFRLFIGSVLFFIFLKPENRTQMVLKAGAKAY
jgi:hypothetical protein